MLTKAFIKEANKIKHFSCDWGTFGRANVCSKLLNDNCLEVEKKASIDGLIQFFTENTEELKNKYYETLRGLEATATVEIFFKFVVYDYGNDLASFNDGGNVTYTLSYR